MIRRSCLVGIISLCFLAVRANGEPIIRLAGTFNNWSTVDDEYRMSGAGDRYELSQYWLAGRYQFKFAFDGSWSRHLGGVGEKRLAQPGENIVLRIPEAGYYRIKIDLERNEWGFDRDESRRNEPPPLALRSKMSFETPDWAKRAVWYQIFPERFRNGDSSNDPPGTVPWRHAWYEPYKGPGREKGKFWDYIFDRRYGGDIQGIREKLPYLRRLGITAIYLNPVFQAES